MPDRASGSGAPADDIVTVGDLTIDIGKRRVTLGENEVRFTAIEYKIVSLLAKNVGRVLTYDYIIKEIWGPYASSDNQILRVNMANIRRKLEESPAEPRYIVTELGVGYRMDGEIVKVKEKAVRQRRHLGHSTFCTLGFSGKFLCKLDF